MSKLCESIKSQTCPKRLKQLRLVKIRCTNFNFNPDILVYYYKQGSYIPNSLSF